MKKNKKKDVIARNQKIIKGGIFMKLRKLPLKYLKVFLEICIR